MLWVALLTLPLMMGVQEICDRTALASGKTLGELIAVHFKRGWQTAIGALIAVLVVANALNIAADLVAIGRACTCWMWDRVRCGARGWRAHHGAFAVGSFLVIARVFKCSVLRCSPTSRCCFWSASRGGPSP